MDRAALADSTGAAPAKPGIAARAASRFAGVQLRTVERECAVAIDRAADRPTAGSSVAKTTECGRAAFSFVGFKVAVFNIERAGGDVNRTAKSRTARTAVDRTSAPITTVSDIARERAALDG